jgi:hypothetical protein
MQRTMLEAASPIRGSIRVSRLRVDAYCNRNYRRNRLRFADSHNCALRPHRIPTDVVLRCGVLIQPTTAGRAACAAAGADDHGHRRRAARRGAAREGRANGWGRVKQDRGRVGSGPSGIGLAGRGVRYGRRRDRSADAARAACQVALRLVRPHSDRLPPTLVGSVAARAKRATWRTTRSGQPYTVQHTTYRRTTENSVRVLREHWRRWLGPQGRPIRK